MNKIANRSVICNVLMEAAIHDHDLLVCVSDSRGSASLTPFTKQYPAQTIEVGIAEQNLVGIAAGLASCGKKPYVASPASFLSMRSIEQIKVDVAYSQANVKLIGISAGISYGALGMTHHSLQDIAVMNAIPNMVIVNPADRFETELLMKQLLVSKEPTYIRVGRNAVADLHDNCEFDCQLGKGMLMKQGRDCTIIATGEMVQVACLASDELSSKGILARVINIHTLKPLDEQIIIEAAKQTNFIITLEEHSVHGGLGSMVASVVSEKAPCQVKILGIPDECIIAGEAQECFEYYGLTASHVSQLALELMQS